MEQNPSGEIYSSAGRYISSCIQIIRVLYRAHRSLLLDSILSQINPLCALMFYLLRYSLCQNLNHDLAPKKNFSVVSLATLLIFEISSSCSISFHFITLITYYGKSINCEASHIILPILLSFLVSSIQIFLSNFAIFTLSSI